MDHDVLFRAGIGVDGTDTFTPRTIIYDLKSGFGSLRKLNALYETEDNSGPIRGLWWVSQQPLWTTEPSDDSRDGPTSAQRQESIPSTQYQNNLEQGLPTFQLHPEDVRYWSDFNRVFYHPRSIVQLSDYELNSQLRPFESWSTGEELFHNLHKEFDLLDRDFRPFAEESDQLQAIQVLAEADNAWGGFASQYADNLRDEYGKTSIWMWALEDGRRVSIASVQETSCEKDV